MNGNQAETEGMNMTQSWIIVSRETGKAVFETWSRKIADCVNTDKYEVLSAQEHLARMSTDYQRKRREQSKVPLLGS